MTRRTRSVCAIAVTMAMILSLSTPAVAADPDPDEFITDGETIDTGLDASDLVHDDLAALDEMQAEAEALVEAAGLADVISSGPSVKKADKRGLELQGRGSRLVPDATTDVWALGKYAYTGTFNSPCGGEAGAGIQVWDVKKKKSPTLVGVIPSPAGSRSNDVKVAKMNSGDILVHSNEACAAGGPGGFEIWDVKKPKAPVLLASVQTDDVNLLLQGAPFFFTDFGVHNLFLFKQGKKDYVAAVVESEFGNFQIFDITDPTSPALVGFWGAEQSPNAVAFGIPAGTDWVNTDDFGLILDADAYLFSGFGSSTNRFLHDVTISADGQSAYLSNWDEGLVLLDISDPTSPTYVSTALDIAGGSLDGEVNSHAAWPNKDGSIVVEGEEDFSAWEANIPPGNLTLDGTATPGDPTIPATAIATNDGMDFEDNQTGNIGSTDGTSVTVDSGPLAGNVYPAVELATAAGSPTFADTGTLSGELVWIGRACTATGGDAPLNAGAVDPGDIAVVLRGFCEFEEKANAAAALGAAAVIISNNQSSTPWSGLRIWDYSDPTAPVLASTFNTPCSASVDPIADGCDPFGTYSAHNVIVDKDNRAYISWYFEGVVVLDISDPYNPVEIARYSDSGAAFEAQNGGPQDVWGVYKDGNKKEIYASDRNGGLYILKDKTKKPKKPKK